MASSCTIGHCLPGDMLSVVRGAVCSILSTIGPKPTDRCIVMGFTRIQSAMGLGGHLRQPHALGDREPASIRGPAAFGIGLHFEPFRCYPRMVEGLELN